MMNRETSPLELPHELTLLHGQHFWSDILSLQRGVSRELELECFSIGRLESLPLFETPGHNSVKPRVMTPQSSVNFPKTHLKTAQNSAKQYKKRVLRAVFALQGLLTYVLAGAGISTSRCRCRLRWSLVWRGGTSRWRRSEPTQEPATNSVRTTGSSSRSPSRHWCLLWAIPNVMRVSQFAPDSGLVMTHFVGPE